MLVLDSYPDFSNLFAFLAPFKRYTVKVMAAAVQRYLSQPGASYRKVADELSALWTEAGRLSHSTVWRWVKEFCEKAKTRLLIRTQGLCLSAGTNAERMAEIEKRAMKRRKKHYDEGDRLVAGRLAAALAMALTKRKVGALEALHFIFLKQHVPEAIFAGNRVRLLNPQSMELILF